MPEFVPVLVAATFMLVLLLVVFGGSFLSYTDGGNRSKTITLGENLNVGTLQALAASLSQEYRPGSPSLPAFPSLIIRISQRES